MHRTPVLLSLGAFLFVTACGLSVEDFETRRDAAQCAYRDRCVHPLFNAFEQDWSGPCESWDRIDAAATEQYAAAMERGTLELLPGAETCLEVMENPDAGCADAVACAELYRGLVKEGGECRLDEECTKGTHCVTSACPGTCVADAYDGYACSLDSECRSGACDQGVCAESPRGLGERCLGDWECDSGLCDGYDLMREIEGRCAERAGAGSPCEWDVECAPFHVCVSGVCRDRAEAFVLRKGDACGWYEGPYCEEGLVCAWDDLAAGQGRCSMPVGSGEACVPAFPDPCPSGEYCDVDAGRCLPRPTDGEPCGAGGATAIRLRGASFAYTCAAEHACVGGVCRWQGLAGDSCAENSDCWFESCEDGACADLVCQPDWY